MSVVDLGKYPGLRVLAGSKRVEGAPFPPFDDEACAFLDEVSRALMTDAWARSFPDVVSFAYWCRRGNVQRERLIREGFLENRIGRGVALHIAPGNVPVNFAFSYAFSLLAGNATIVRCSSREFPQTGPILDAMRGAFANHPNIARRSALVSYLSSGTATSDLSRIADVRVIWGGDKTVGAIRALPAKPRCIDIAFADRYSFAMLSVAAVAALDEAGLARLARGFYNDTYLMDQNACSSPQTVLWVLDGPEIGPARKRFWDAVVSYARGRYEMQAAVAVDKHVQLCSEVARGIVGGFEETDGLLTTAWITDGQPLSTDLRGVGGFFHEHAVSGLSAVADFADEKCQTIVQFGLDSNDLRREVFELGLTGIDRIVSVGSAMDIGLVWDGYDLIDAMSRIVSIS